MNHIETKTLKSHKISKSCYRGGYSQGNDALRSMALRIVFLLDKVLIHMHKPGNVSNEETDLNCTKFSR